MSTRLHGTSCLMDDVKSFYNLYVNNVHIIMHAHYALFSLRIFVSGVTWWKSSSLVRCLHYCGLFGLCQCLISYGTPWADCLGLLSLGIPQNGTHIPCQFGEKTHLRACGLLFGRIICRYYTWQDFQEVNLRCSTVTIGKSISLRMVCNGKVLFCSRQSVQFLR